jgi:hypothetical protein
MGTFAEQTELSGFVFDHFGGLLLLALAELGVVGDGLEVVARDSRHGFFGLVAMNSASSTRQSEARLMREITNSSKPSGSSNHQRGGQSVTSGRRGKRIRTARRRRRTAKYSAIPTASVVSSLGSP